MIAPRAFVLLLGTALLLMAGTAGAQDYPVRPIRFLTTGIGASTDLAALSHSMLRLFHNMRAAVHIPDQPPDKAPPEMIKTYGSANGFGWNLNEVMGAQVVSVPMSVPLARADRAFGVVMGLLTAVFLRCASPPSRRASRR